MLERIVIYLNEGKKIETKFVLGTLVVLDYGGRDEKIVEELLANLDFISPNEVSLILK